MKTYSSDILPKIEILGKVLRIHLNEIKDTKDVMGKPFIQYAYDTISVSTDHTRAQLIQDIIADKYSTADEIALLHNQTLKPLEFIAYQDYRTLAKTLADEALLAISKL